MKYGLICDGFDVPLLRVSFHPLKFSDWEKLGKYLSPFADLLSLLGFFVTLYAAWTIRRLSARFVFWGRVDDYKTGLDEVCTQLNDALAAKSFSSGLVAEILEPCRVTLKKLKNGPDEVAKMAKDVDGEVKWGLEDAAGRLSLDYTSKLLRHLRALGEEISHHLKERRITPI
ncbi:hypothetical protein [Luteolibacter luteus]|uniref:Uncharacterized protein n=1 Tax=Luteolibacter luteus TaxID=2728835 RepID=A0A858RP34_9BACT|nr:hypothetical protein [Luteolibacter luteus]QJE98787.1 hypothetical protein HHL09_24400 [Luteolibacter luteus]